MERKTHTIDATGKVFGRLASQIAVLLHGKHKPEFETHIDLGDIVIVKNAGGVVFTGKKLMQIQYHRYSGYPGGLKTEKAKGLIIKNPEKMLRQAVYNMLPKNRLRSQMIKRLRFIK